MPILSWILSQDDRVRGQGFVDQFADFRQLPKPPKDLQARAHTATEQFPCDILFVHRDAEKEPLEARVREIETALSAANVSPYVPVIPVKMTEAWLLWNESAIRRAAGNPNGTADLELPPLAQLEGESDPKKTLQEALLKAAEKQGRRKKQFQRDIPRRVGRVAELIDDFSPLRVLSAFQELEQRIRELLDDWKPRHA